MFGIAIDAWASTARAARAMPACFAICAAILCLTSLTTLWAVEYLAPGATTKSFAWAALAEILLVQALVLLWAQGAVMRLVLRHTLRGEKADLTSLLPDASLLGIGATMALTEFLSIGAIGGLLPAYFALDHRIGRTSALLSLGLLVPLASIAAAIALRRSLTPAPLALNLGAALAESWEITRGHIAFAAGVYIIAFSPVVLVLLASVMAAGKPDLDAPQILLATILAITLFGLQAALTARLYERWRTQVRPDMRPSRNRARRIDPLWF